MLNKEQEGELYSFIVDSGLEWSFIDQLNDKKHKDFFIKWLGMEDELNGVGMEEEFKRVGIR